MPFTAPWETESAYNLIFACPQPPTIYMEKDVSRSSSIVLNEANTQMTATFCQHVLLPVDRKSCTASWLVRERNAHIRYATGYLYSNRIFVDSLIRSPSSRHAANLHLDQSEECGFRSADSDSRSLISLRELFLREVHAKPADYFLLKV